MLLRVFLILGSSGGECGSSGDHMESLEPADALQDLPSISLLDLENAAQFRSRSASVSSTGSSGRFQLRQRVAQLMACVEDVSSDDEIHDEVSRTIDEAFLICGKKQKDKLQEIRFRSSIDCLLHISSIMDRLSVSTGVVIQGIGTTC